MPLFEPLPPENRLTSMLIRLPPNLANQLRDLSRRTRIRQSEYLREAVRDLLEKYVDLMGSDPAPLPLVDAEAEQQPERQAS